MSGLVLGGGESVLAATEIRWTAEFLRGLEHVRYWAGPVLIVGGGTADRLALARLIHQRGPMRDGWFRNVDCRRIGFSGGRAEQTIAEGGAGRGTAFLNFLEHMPVFEQHALFGWLESRALRAADSMEFGARIVAGIGHVPNGRIRPASILPALFDTLDKWRIDVGR